MRSDDSGAGVISTFVGASIFIVFLLFAAQLLLGLYTTSVVAAVAYDAAKTAAGADALGRQGARDQAAADARRQLGAVGRTAEFLWAEDGDAIALTVRVRRPAVLPGVLPNLRPTIVRTARVRTERVR